MQTVACDIDGKLVQASRAKRKEAYFCLHCHGPVKQRRGLFRRPHFYHLSQDLICHPRKRSLIHRQIQDFIQQQFPDEHLILEKRFPSIGRVADLCWPARGLVFEIQCSSISHWEIQGRNEDYRSVGYQVVWVLLAERYYKKKISESEAILFYHPYFFITKSLDCFIDHAPITKKGKRKEGKRMSVCFTPFSIERVTRKVRERIPFLSSIRQFFYIQWIVIKRLSL